LRTPRRPYQKTRGILPDRKDKAIRVRPQQIREIVQLTGELLDKRGDFTPGKAALSPAPPLEKTPIRPEKRDF